MGTSMSASNMASWNAGLSGIQAGGALATSIAQAGAAGAQAAYQDQQFKFNAKVADIQAEDAIERGGRAANAVRREAAKVKGAQRAAYAAQGIDPNTGSAADVQAETDYFSELDALTIRSNAFREAFGYKVDAMNSRGRGEFAKIAGQNQATNTLVTGGLQALQYGMQGFNYASKAAGGKGY